MNTYIFELVITHSALIFAYWLFLSKENQYHKMRLYLLGSTALAIIIPLLRLPKLFPSQNQTVQVLSPDFMAMEAPIITTTTETPLINIETVYYISLAISCILVLKIFLRIIALVRSERRCTIESYNGYHIRRVDKLIGSFTFFNWIFLSNDIDKNQADYQAILKHELAHVNLKHSYDLVFFEIYKAFFWWLPSAWYINKEIKKIHEYQADAYALRSTNIEEYSSILIKTTLQSNGLSLVSSFHDGLIFKRLKAMKQQVKTIKRWKLGVLTSLGVFLFITFACTQENSPTTLTNKAQEQRDVFTIVEEQPSYAGGMDAFYKYVIGEMKYPLQARKSGVEGTVQVQFTIERNGSISNATAINNIGSGCDEEAIRVVENAPGFIAGSQRGRTIKTAMVMPITFKLNKEKKNADNTMQGTIIAGELTTIPKELKVTANYNNGEWTGTVLNATGDKLPGVNIVVAGTNYGTVSNLSGTFSVKTEKNQELHISCVGYESVVIKN